MITVDYGNGNWFDRWWQWCYVLVACLLGVLLAYHHWLIVSAPFPLDYYEGTHLLITQIIAEGGNPYTREFQPQAMYVYPPLYNMLVAPFSLLTEDGFTLHRATCAILIIASCLIVFRAVIHAGGGPTHALAAAVTCYAGLLFFTTPVSSSNALGVLLYLLGLYIPWRHGFAKYSIGLAIVLGIAAFYSKQYFVLGMGILCAWLFLCYSVSRSLVVGLQFSAVILGSLAVVNYFSPYFLDNTLFSTAISAGRLQSTEIALLQYRDLAALYWPLILLVALQLAMSWRTSVDLRSHPRLVLPQLRWRSGYPREYPPVVFFWFASLLCAVVVFFSLARNPGNYLSYLFQLLTPLLLIAVFSSFGKLAGAARFAQPLILVGFFQVWNLLPHDFSSTPENWRKVDAIIASEQQVFASQMLIGNLLKHERTVYQDGHTFYFPLAKDKPAFFIKEDEMARVEVLWKQYIADLYQKIAAQEFDAILLTSWDFRGVFLTNPPPGRDISGRDFLLQYYELDETFPLSMTSRHGGGEYEMRVWRPRAQ